MEAVLSKLAAQGVKIETVDTYLLDSSDHKIRVPCTLDGISVQVGFFASMPAWSDRVRAHLQVCFAGGRRWSIYEGAGGFQVSRIVARISQELKSRAQEHTKRLEELEKKRLAEDKFNELSTAIGVATQAPLNLCQDNLEIIGLADKPSEVRVIVHTTHANAVKIAREFRNVSWRARKA